MRQYKPEGAVWRKFNTVKREMIEGAMATGAILEATASKCDDALNLYIDLCKDTYGVIPFDEFEYHFDDKKTKNVAVISRVAKNTCFKVISIETDDNGKTKVNLSRKAAQKECYEEYISKLEVGQVIDARITHIESYGAFCDIGCGIIALLPIEHFCIARIKDPKIDMGRFRNLKVIVKSISDDGRIILTQKELLGTWEEEASKFNPGDTVVGTVRMIEDYGVFVELTPNLTGLAEPCEGLKVGDVVAVLIKGISPSKMKVKLIITDKDNISKPYIHLDYRIPESGKLRDWVYSPSGCEKRIESHF